MESILLVFHSSESINGFIRLYEIKMKKFSPLTSYKFKLRENNLLTSQLNSYNFFFLILYKLNKNECHNYQQQTNLIFILTGQQTCNKFPAFVVASLVSLQTIQHIHHFNMASVVCSGSCKKI